MHTEPPESDLVRLDEAVLSGSFVGQPGNLRFCKAEIARTPELLYQAAATVQASLQARPDALCILATSGVPLGCVLSQTLSVPAHFYRRDGWKVSIGLKDTRYRVLPPISSDASVVLVDSHARTGGTASSCYRALADEAPGASVRVLVTLVGLDHIVSGRDLSSLREKPVVRISENAEYLAGLFESDVPGLLATHLQLGSKAWSLRRTGAGRSQAGRLATRLRGVFNSPSAYPTPEVLDQELAKELRKWPKLGTDLGMWDFFTSTSLQTRIASVLDTSLDLSRYSALVGVCLPGSALAWILAFHTHFVGPVFSCYESPGIVPTPDGILDGKRLLLVQARMITGQDTEEVIGRVHHAGGRCSDVLVLWWAPETTRPSRCAPLRRLHRDGIRFIALGGL
jgi:adenine/guanine phosphoribosyltransferase-like PRPP-binding protein